MYRRACGLCYFARDAFLPIGRSLLSLAAPRPQKGTSSLSCATTANWALAVAHIHIHTKRIVSVACVKLVDTTHRSLLYGIKWSRWSGARKELSCYKRTASSAKKRPKIEARNEPVQGHAIGRNAAAIISPLWFFSACVRPSRNGCGGRAPERRE
jgi:hypothetical protein